MKVLAVTGLTGKSGTGAALVEILAENARTIVERFPDGVKLILNPSRSVNSIKASFPTANIIYGDLTDVNSLLDIFAGVDTILHVAGIHWSRKVFEAAAKCGVRRVIAVHTTGVYSKYKEASEVYRQIDSYVYDICEKNHIKLTILRPTMIYGKTTDNNVSTFIKMVDKFPVMPVVNGAKYELQPVHCSDVAKGCYEVLINEDNTAGKDFVLSGKEPIMLREMLEVIGINLGKKVRFISCPYFIAYPGACILYFFSLKRVDLREKVQRLCEPRVFSHEAATKAFGFYPMTFEEGIIQEVMDYKEGK